MRRHLFAVAPLVFWNLCQSEESIYRECLFDAASGISIDRFQVSTDEIRALCREASGYSRIDQAIDRNDP